MEVYILDSLFRRIKVVDIFESLIWTERFSAAGDFELTLHSTLENRNLFPAGTRLAINESYRVMTVETIEDGTDDSGNEILKVSGPSLESILQNRAARGSLSDLTTEAKWSITDLPAAIARKVFHDICVTGTLDPGDVIPNINETSIFSPGTIPEPSTSVTIELEPMSVYDAETQICGMYALGFRLVRNGDSPQLYFDVYSGSDRTTQQTSLQAVIFSPGLGNLQKTKELTTVTPYKNVAYVISPVGHQIVYAQGADSTTAGFDRRVLIVKADDINDTVAADATAKMIQRGNQELAKNRRMSAFDGEINQNSAYKYGTDYQLGDLVDLQNKDGAISQMRVTEQIFVSDKEGERSYPTLTLNEFMTPGSWSAWSPPMQSWYDLDASTTAWADQT